MRSERNVTPTEVDGSARAGLEERLVRFDEGWPLAAADDVVGRVSRRVRRHRLRQRWAASAAFVGLLVAAGAAIQSGERPGRKTVIERSWIAADGGPGVEAGSPKRDVVVDGGDRPSSWRAVRPMPPLVELDLVRQRMATLAATSIVPFETSSESSS